MPPPAPAPAPVEEECYSLYSNMLFNNLLQSFSKNPDSNAMGYVLCTLCTSGKMSCQANVHGGLTPLIASHIHVAKSGDGVNGSGPPVINFCGTNEQYRILDMPGAPYLEPCAPYVKGGSSWRACRTRPSALPRALRTSRPAPGSTTLQASDKKCHHQAETLDFLKTFTGWPDSENIS
ncbi:unnamed protein product [Polarella glacialis]|uniref:Uncharacterized protein n=1 Tax=Polarella glacialis TaxID=89957 RepID=A0A813FCE4_POLGL|nr:unnamed protein product [Polarella glacialis]